MNSKKLYFTLCSNNYLASAITLGRSIEHFSSDSRFVIGLVDLPNSEIDYLSFGDFEVLPCMDLGVPEFESMLMRYNIIEFNTAVKPYYLDYLFKENPEIDQVYYLDPDIEFYQSPDLMEMEFGEDEILLTPNQIYPSDMPNTGEFTSLRHGIYNLGFIGLKRGMESFRLIQWWKERLREHCRIDKCNGVFVDQKWIDLAPLFFDKLKLVKHPGWNMAWWNFNERKLLEIPSGYSVNQPETHLLFFHFSGFRPEKPFLTERLNSEEFQMGESAALTKLFEDYKVSLLANGYNQLSKMKPGLSFRDIPKSPWNKIGRKIKSKLNNLIYRIFKV